MVAFGADSSSSGPTLSTRKLQGKLDKLDPTKRLTILDWLVTFRAACGADFSEFFSEVQLEIPKTKEEFLSRFISDPKYIADDKWDALTWSPRPLPGLLHAWDTQDCSLHFSVWATYLENGLELCNQTSQKHSHIGDECFCKVWLRNSKRLVNGGTQTENRSEQFVRICGQPSVQQARRPPRRCG